MEKDEIEKIIKETALAVSQSTKRENSGLVGDMQKKLDSIYTKREQDLMFNSIHEKLDEVLKGIETNGKTTISLQLWRSWMAGGMGIIVLLVFPLLIYIFSSKVNDVEAKIKTIQDEKTITRK